MSRLSAVAVTGNLSAPSRSVVLARAALDALAGLRDFDVRVIDLSSAGSALVSAVRRADVEAQVADMLLAAETADVLVAVTPVHRGSFTGLFKHYFDLLDGDALQDVPVILGATSGSARHTLVVEYALRPLFAFFRAHTVPTALYAADADFDAGRTLLPALQHRVAEAAEQAVSLLVPRTPRTALSHPRVLRQST